MTAGARDEGRGEPLRGSEAKPGLIQRGQKGPRVLGCEDPRHPGVKDCFMVKIH